MPHDGFGDSDSGQASDQAPLGYTPRWRHPMPSSPPPLLLPFMSLARPYDGKRPAAVCGGVCAVGKGSLVGPLV